MAATKGVTHHWRARIRPAAPARIPPHTMGWLGRDLNRAFAIDTSRDTRKRTGSAMSGLEKWTVGMSCSWSLKDGRPATVVYAAKTSTGSVVTAAASANRRQTTARLAKATMAHRAKVTGRITPDGRVNAKDSATTPAARSHRR